MIFKAEAGAAVINKVNADLKRISLVYRGEEFDRVKVYEMFGRLNMAVEIGIISLEQWEKHLVKLMLLLNGD